MTELSQRRRYLETRQEIISAAYQIIRSSGVDGLSMRAIARAVHMSPANLYEYFANKDEIVHSVFAKTMAALEAKAHQVDKNLPPQEYLIALCLGYLEFATKEQEQMLVMSDTIQASSRVRLAATSGPVTMKSPVASTTGLFDLFLSGVERYLQSKAIVPPPQLNAEEIAHTLLALVYGLVAVSSHELRTIAPAAVRAAVQTLLSGLSMPSAAPTVKESLYSLANAAEQYIH